MREGRPSNLSGEAYSTRSTSLSYVDESGAGLLAILTSASSSEGAGAASWCSANDTVFPVPMGP